MHLEGSRDPREASDKPHIDEAGRLRVAYRYDYRGSCWWCGSPADSREHKYKRTDAKRQFGPGAWRGENALVRVVGSDQRYVQGPNSDELKFAKVLCSTCNSTRSQRADNAYDCFAEYINANNDTVLREGGFSWSAIFPHDWEDGRNYVTAYWLKHIGCCLAENGIRVDPSIGTFMDDPASVNIPLALGLEIRDDIAVALRKYGTGGLWKGDMQAQYSRSRARVWQARSFWGVNWLRLNYLYEENLVGVCNYWDEVVELPRGWNIDPADI